MSLPARFERIFPITLWASLMVSVEWQIGKAPNAKLQAPEKSQTPKLGASIIALASLNMATTLAFLCRKLCRKWPESDKVSDKISDKGAGLGHRLATKMSGIALELFEQALVKSGHLP